MDEESLRSWLEKINAQLAELATFLQEVGKRPKSANQTQLYSSVVEERARLISLADAVCKELVNVGYSPRD